MTQHPERPFGPGGDHPRRARRWRLKLALRGAAIAAGCVAVALVLSALTLQWMRFTPESILMFRIGLAWWSRCVPTCSLSGRCCARVTDEQVALYLEEHEPSLEAAIISAVEAERTGLSRAVAGAGAQAGRGRGGEVPRARRRPPRRAHPSCGGIRARSAACSPSRRAIFLLGPPTCATRCRRCS
jgi:hypothetical protein